MHRLNSKPISILFIALLHQYNSAKKHISFATLFWLFMIIYAHKLKDYIMPTETNIESVYKSIKKQNGEAVAKILREHVLLDIPNLKHILEFAGKKPADAIALLPTLREIQLKSKNSSQTIQQTKVKDPIELLSDAGYDAFYVNTLDEQNSIKKYFRPGEELCTFRDKDRYKQNYMIHAVKRGAENIKPSNNPEREDEYGTSVISIQIAKTGGFISIKNRYNHTVNNPDATFNNNPDNIIEGLTEALKNKFNVDFTTQYATLPNNYRIINDQLVRFNYEIDNTYFDEKYYFRGSEITKLNTSQEVMLDNVILDTKTNKVRSVLPSKNNGIDELVRVLNDEISGHKVKIETDKTTKETVIKIIDDNKQEKELVRTQNGCITSLNLYKTEHLGIDFLRHNKTLKTLNAPQLQAMESDCFRDCDALTTLSLPKLQAMERNCFQDCDALTTLSLPKLQAMEYSCFHTCNSLIKVNLPNLQTMKNYCFHTCNSVTEVNLPNSQIMGIDCFSSCHSVTEVNLSKLQHMGENCFNLCDHLTTLHAPELQSMEKGCFRRCDSLTTLHAPWLQSTGNRCFEHCLSLTEVNLPKLQHMGENCFNLCDHLTTLHAPELQSMEKGCFHSCDLTTLTFPKLQTMDDGCFVYVRKLNSVYAPELQTIGNSCFYYCNLLTILYAPKLQSMDRGCFNNCDSLIEATLPQLQTMGKNCFINCDSLTDVTLPQLPFINGGCFHNCKSLTTLYAPELDRIDANCFVTVKKLKSLYAPKLKIDENTPDCIRCLNKNRFQIAMAKLKAIIGITDTNVNQHNTLPTESNER